MSGLQGLALADFNGDKLTDIAQLGDDYKQVSIFTGNGKGAFVGAPMLASTTDTNPSPSYLVLQNVMDVQGKGYSSAVFGDVSSATPQIVTGVGDGKGNLSYVVGLSAASIPTLGYVEPVQADFNRDGKGDLLIANQDGTVSVALSNGDGTFQSPVALALPPMDCEVAYAATGDVNGDGIPDIVLSYGGDANCGGREA